MAGPTRFQRFRFGAEPCSLIAEIDASTGQVRALVYEPEPCEADEAILAQPYDPEQAACDVFRARFVYCLGWLAFQLARRPDAAVRLIARLLDRLAARYALLDLISRLADSRPPPCGTLHDEASVLFTRVNPALAPPRPRAPVSAGAAA